MISFVCGTYHGLFVQTEVASVLPSDLAYFDFRRNHGWGIPEGAAPNLIVRYTDNLLTVSLIYKAQEGNRGGFIGFGTLIIDPRRPISAEIEKALIKAVKQAQSSKDIFDGTHVLKRPAKNGERELDLTELPIFNEVELYGQLKFDIFKPGAIKELAREISSIIDNFDAFEILVKSSDGLSQSELLQSFDEQIRQHYIEKELEARKIKREVDRKNALAALEKQRENDAREQKEFIITLTSYIVGALALFLLGIFMVYFFVFQATELEDTPKESPNVDQLTPTASIDATNVDEVPTVDRKEDDKSCQLEDLKDVLANKLHIVTDIKIGNLSNVGKCVELGANAQSILSSDLGVITREIESDIIFSSNSVFENNLPKERMILSKFSNFINRYDKSDGFDLFYTNQQIPTDENLFNFALSFEEFVPRFRCNSNVFSKTADLYREPKFYYLIGENAGNFSIETILSRQAIITLKEMYGSLSEKLKVSSKENHPPVGNAFKSFAQNVRLELIEDLSKLDLATPSCLISLAENEYLQPLLNDFKKYDFSSFFMEYQEILDSKEIIPKVDCGLFPKYLLAWRAKGQEERRLYELKLDNEKTLNTSLFDFNITAFEPSKGKYFWPSDHDNLKAAAHLLSKSSDAFKDFTDNQGSRNLCDLVSKN